MAILVIANRLSICRAALFGAFYETLHVGVVFEDYQARGKERAKAYDERRSMRRSPEKINQEWHGGGRGDRT
jgi:hypothetical protein